MTILSLYNKVYEALEEKELLLKCEQVFEVKLTVTAAESDYLSKATYLQSEYQYMPYG